MGKFAAKGTSITGPGGLIAQVFAIAGATLSADTVDVSDHESAKFYREFVNTFRDAGEVTLGLRFDPAEATQSEVANGLIALFELDVSSSYTILWPNTGASTWVFDAFVTGYEPSADFDADLEATITLKLTGDPVYTA